MKKIPSTLTAAVAVIAAAFFLSIAQLNANLVDIYLNPSTSYESDETTVNFPSSTACYLTVDTFADAPSNGDDAIASADIYRIGGGGTSISAYSDGLFGPIYDFDDASASLTGTYKLFVAGGVTLGGISQSYASISW